MSNGLIMISLLMYVNNRSAYKATIIFFFIKEGHLQEG